MATQAKKQRLAENREMQKCKIHDLCEEHGIEMEHITEYQIRLNGKVDVFPTSQKIAILRKGKPASWGMYSRPEEILKFIQ